jgi:hypothetical protein
MSTIANLGNLGYVTSTSLFSTVAGLGSLGYASTLTDFKSTVTGLGSIGYVSTATLNTKFDTLGNWYVSSPSMASTVDGLSTFGYATNINLSTVFNGLSAMKNAIRFDTVNAVTVIGGTNTFTNPGNIIYVSTFYQSSMMYSGPQPGVQFQGRIPPGLPNDMEFSTAVIRLDALSSFIDSNSWLSRITIDVFPTLAFTPLGTGAIGTNMLTISTMLRAGQPPAPIYTTTTTNYMYAGSFKTTVGGTPALADLSNIYNQPIRLTIPQGTVLDYRYPFTIYHYMPRAVQNGPFQNGLHSNFITPYFGSTGSVFVSVQNSV